ncbi:MAG: PQQ-binding-like beta-propeller repeat protein [Bauldia sp.]|nr:PQQ-binding-like beta-propeller repeat protein [Bauldia sp.]
MSMLAGGAAVALSATAALAADDWPMATYDVANTRHAVGETIIGVDNVARLAPKATIATGGNNWATAIIGAEGAFIVDQGGMLSNVDPKTGEVAWQHPISDYNGVENSVVRTSPVYGGGMVFMGDRGGANMIAVDAASGDLVWITDLDAHPNAQITGSPIILGDVLYVGVSSAGAYQQVDGRIRSNFRGSLVALDINTGDELWRSYTIPENGGAMDSWSGGAIISSPAIDVASDTIYFHGDHYYGQPEEVLECLTAAPDDWDPSCYPPDALANALIAADLHTGEVKWSFIASGPDAYEMVCSELPSITWQIPVQHFRMCPPAGDWVNWGFAVGSPNLFTATIDGVERELVGVGQKSGFYWTFDAHTGEVVWATWVGPFSEPGGLAQGAAYDGERLYVSVANMEYTPHFVGMAPCAGGVCAMSDHDETPIWGGSWAALDPATGAILWQTAEPSNSPVYGSPTVANGVVYVSSLAPTGSQMFALSAETGEILWEFEAGGSVTSNPAVVDGHVYWGSGFGLFGGAPNDKFYVFTVDGR